MPTPPQFFSPTPVSPNVSVYHLHTADIVRLLRASRCHRHGWTGRGIRIAMTDTGFARHPFFNANGFNIQRVSTPSISNPEIDTSGHGTGESANALSIAPDCEFFGVKHDDYSVEALETAIAQNPQIITNSWGWDIDSKSMQQLKLDNVNLYNEIKDIEQTISDAIDDGICVIFAGGNGQLAFPGSMPSVVSVGGTSVAQDGGLKASSYASSFVSSLYPNRAVPDFCGIVGEFGFSSPLEGHIMLPVPNGSKLEGENMPSSESKKGWGIFSGTSAAAPQVAGIVALMLSVNPHLTPDEIKAILSATAVDVTTGTTAHRETADNGNDLATGSGLVDAYSACLQVQQTLATC
uniref:Subtilase family protein n=1 Tax=Candidatus Kentrum sp. MB TaxID=2138164 RepID=A0A450XZM5_9GAMM|nr:MAG: Subtilase family protein [Candidatus Kentron sp. MB]VFK34716.1 MAG: Subtilase family protein [Candidatus Kentron sp. MB]VFK76962.1 MAG: Subtilase family protein [Candidatus Kentron sp. MB]